MLKKIVVVFVFVNVLFFGISCTPTDSSEKKLINIEIWTYYNGAPKIAFDKGVDLFNKTVGKEKGIFVNTICIDHPRVLANDLVNSCKMVSGSKEIPNLVSIYPDTALFLNEMGCLLSLDKYFTAEELDEFVPSFIEEGRLRKNGPFLLFPALKSSEVLFYNKTDWAKFEEACGVKIEDIKSIEKLVEISELYYNWTNSLTPNIPHDGKALFGRDALGNYFFFGLHQLGYEISEMTTEKVKRDVYKLAFKKLWDNYYIPFIKGYFLAKATFRSDDMKMGRILLSVGSSAGVNYLAQRVILEDNTSHDIEIGVRPEPLFMQSKSSSAIQQGAGFAVLKSNREENAASITFLKWLVKKDVLKNLAVNASYIPALKAPLEKENIDELLKENNIVGKHQVAAAKLTAKLMLSRDVFAPKPFKHSLELRHLFVDSLKQISSKDRTIVEKRLAEGRTTDSAMKEFLSDAYFEKWYRKISEEIIEVINEK